MAKTILIVEDDPLNMKLENDLLQTNGYNTIPIRNGENIVELVRDRKPDLIIMDIQLPNISGLDITKLLKADEKLKDIPVIAVTAFAMRGDKEKMLEGGCDDYISKPISIENFLGVIAKHLS